MAKRQEVTPVVAASRRAAKLVKRRRPVGILGDRVFVILRQRFRGRGSGVDVEARTACTYRLRDGALTELRSYGDVAEGLAAAGLDP